MIYIELTDEERASINSPEDLINILYEYSSHNMTTRATFYDEACEDLQCSDKTRRSFNDIYELCNTYFPGIKKYKVLSAIFKSNVNGHYTCHMIKATVFHNRNSHMENSDSFINAFIDAHELRLKENPYDTIVANDTALYKAVKYIRKLRNQKLNKPLTS